MKALFACALNFAASALASSEISALRMASPRRGDGGADVGGVAPTGVEGVDDPL